MIFADEDRIRQVFTNLIENGLKYTSTGGNVNCGMKLVNGWIEAYVEDSGPGIPAQELERVFERFYQLDKARSGGNQRGVGLGLAIAREIVKAHGGIIYVTNKQAINPGDSGGEIIGSSEPGCIFTVRLPVVQPHNQSALSSSRGISKFSGRAGGH